MIRLPTPVLSEAFLITGIPDIGEGAGVTPPSCRCYTGRNPGALGRWHWLRKRWTDAVDGFDRVSAYDSFNFDTSLR